MSAGFRYAFSNADADRYADALRARLRPQNRGRSTSLLDEMRLACRTRNHLLVGHEKQWASCRRRDSSDSVFSCCCVCCAAVPASCATCRPVPLRVNGQRRPAPSCSNSHFAGVDRSHALQDVGLIPATRGCQPSRRPVQHAGRSMASGSDGGIVAFGVGEMRFKATPSAGGHGSSDLPASMPCCWSRCPSTGVRGCGGLASRSERLCLKVRYTGPGPGESMTRGSLPGTLVGGSVGAAGDKQCLHGH